MNTLPDELLVAIAAYSCKIPVASARAAQYKSLLFTSKKFNKAAKAAYPRGDELFANNLETAVKLRPDLPWSTAILIGAKVRIRYIFRTLKHPAVDPRKLEDSWPPEAFEYWRGPRPGLPARSPTEVLNILFYGYDDSTWYFTLPPVDSPCRAEILDDHYRTEVGYASYCLTTDEMLERTDRIKWNHASALRRNTGWADALAYAKKVMGVDSADLGHQRILYANPRMTMADLLQTPPKSKDAWIEATKNPTISAAEIISSPGEWDELTLLGRLDAPLELKLKTTEYFEKAVHHQLRIRGVANKITYQDAFATQPAELVWKYIGDLVLDNDFFQRPGLSRYMVALSANRSVTWEIVKKHSYLPWDYAELSAHISVPYEDLQARPNLPWAYEHFVKNSGTPEWVVDKALEQIGPRRAAHFASRLELEHIFRLDDSGRLGAAVKDWYIYITFNPRLSEKVIEQHIHRKWAVDMLCRENVLGWRFIIGRPEILAALLDNK